MYIWQLPESGATEGTKISQKIKKYIAYGYYPYSVKYVHMNIAVKAANFRIKFIYL